MLSSSGSDVGVRAAGEGDMSARSSSAWSGWPGGGEGVRSRLVLRGGGGGEVGGFSGRL